MGSKNKGNRGSQRQKSVAKPETSSSSSSTTTPLSKGTIAPEFSLKTTPDQRVSLGEFRNRPVVLVFYPADFSPVCGDEMALFNELLPEFNRFNAQILGISEDNVWSHIAFSRARNLRFPLLSDFHPKGSVAQQYGVYREADGTAERALYVIDSNGIIRWSYVSPVGVNPGANGVLAALESLSKEKEK